MRYFNSEKGSIFLLFAVILLPTMIFLLFLSLDISRYLLAVQLLQNKADEIVLTANLLDVNTKEYIQKIQSSEQYLTLTANSSTKGNLSVNIRTKFIPIFSSYFLQSSFAIPININSNSKLVPLDIQLLVDSSSYLAPSTSLFEPIAEWSNNLEMPSATYFNINYGNLSYNLGYQISPKNYTERCFNIVLTPLKRGAIMFWDYFSQSSLNNIGVSFFPGSGNTDSNDEPALSPLRNISTVKSNSQESDYFAEYNDMLISDSACARAANSETVHQAIFGWPSYGSQITSIKNRGIDSQTQFHLLEDLNLRQRIWVHPVVENYTGDLTQAIFLSIQKILTLNTTDERRNLAGKSVKLVAIFTGDVPNGNNSKFPEVSFKEQFQNILNQVHEILQEQDEHLKILFFLFRNSERFQSYEIYSLEEYFQKLEGIYSRIKIELIYDNDPDNVLYFLENKTFNSTKQSTLTY